MKRLSLLVASGHLDPIDVELGGLLARRAAAALGEIDEVRFVGMAGAVLSAERARGNSCLDLDALVGAVEAWTDVVGPLLPNVASWQSLLARSGVCGDGRIASPLVLDGSRLYLYRYHAAECRLANSIRGRTTANETGAQSADTVALFRRLYTVAAGVPADSRVDWQAVAAAASMRGRLTVITGGPGTGKTTTVARILALLLTEEPTLRVALAAPTGKAAARLVESIRGSLSTLPLDSALRDRIPMEGQTLHRLLGYRPWKDEFVHGPDALLAEDLVIVDEASMVDVLMMDTLFAALRPSARIILLGDQDQLASVDTGYVLGDLCRAADSGGGTHGRGLADSYHAISGQHITSEPGAMPLRDCVVRLSRSYRFDSQPGISTLAEAIREGSASHALMVLDDVRFPDATRRDPVRSIAALLAPVAMLVDDYLASNDPQQALDHFAAFRILCALRDGNTGVVGLNERVEGWLRSRGVQTRARWYHGKPVLITANDPSTGLHNGDVGVTFIDAGQARVWFHDAAGKARAVSPARLPAHETAWAMTVHKSQGSEFSHVVLVLPEEDSRALTRELLYTGVTRARTAVEVVGSSDMIRLAVERTILRASGLADRLM